MTTPTLLVAGAESFDAEAAAHAAMAHPNKRLLVLPRTGHWVPLDNPSGFLAVVSAFLTRE